MSAKRISRAREAGRLVDVYCDASFKLGVGGWAVVAVRESAPTCEASGRLREAAHSDRAELQSAANALHAAHKAGLIRAGDLAVVRCDNTGVVKRIQARSSSNKPRNAETATALNWILDFAAANGFEVTAAHVKGHQRPDSDDPHAVHNRRCDILAKRATGARGGRAPITIEESRRHAARQSAAAKARNAARAVELARKLGG